MSGWLKVEFHCHSVYSKDSLNPIERLLRVARQRGIDRLVITDHNNVKGALAAQAVDPERIIPGEEIMTDQGELLACFVSEEVPPGLPVLEAIQRLRQQGAFISVSHPFDLRRNGWEREELVRIAPLVDAIEVFNSRCIYGDFNQQASQFARVHDLAGTVGSDAHALYEVGRATLLLPAFSSAEELRDVIRQGQPHTQTSGLAVVLSSWYARTYKRFRPFKG